MNTKLQGYVSCVCTAYDIAELEAISNFAEILPAIHSNFEIIVCVPSGGMISKASIEKICDIAPNLAIYEITSSTIDALITAGLELALGDWILELSDSKTLELDARTLFENLYNDAGGDADSYQLIPDKQTLSDRILSKLASSALEVPVYTLTYMSRLTTRSALQTWNTRKLRSKVLRVAPQLSRSIVKKCRCASTAKANHSRLVRVGLRTVAHSSPRPLRWVSFISLLGALTSVIISGVVVGVGIYKKVVPGWTTTNLQISGLSFLILSVLGILTEYIYQIAAASLGQPAFRIVRETLSPRYAFRINPNIAQSRDK
jgi:hypothetical protein